MKDPVLKSLTFQKLWPRILLHYPEYNVCNRMILIMIILPVDTSGCERIFSRVNLLMSKFQTSMKHETLRNMLIW